MKKRIVIVFKSGLWYTAYITNFSEIDDILKKLNSKLEHVADIKWPRNN